MKEMEQLELDAYRNELVSDMHDLVGKYRKIFGWDIPDIDQHTADKLILAEMGKTLEDIAAKLKS